MERNHQAAGRGAPDGASVDHEKWGKTYLSSSSRHHNKQSDVSRETSLNGKSFPAKFEKRESYLRYPVNPGFDFPGKIR